jgi:peptidoglycan-N-acetylglucosamine deacetylase
MAAAARSSGRGGRIRNAWRARARLAAALLAAAAALGASACGSSGTAQHAGAPGANTGPSASVAQSRAHESALARARASAASRLRRLIALGRPIYCGGARGHAVALTFDDGPGPYTRLVLAKLRKHGVQATFFVVGRNISLVAGATRAERALGALGDHTYTHPLLTALAPADAEAEIASTQAALARSSGARVFLFRPPYGAHDALIDRIARTRGMLTVLWSVDSRDSLGAGYAEIERNVISHLRPGAIILMHENHGQTVRALLGIFAALKQRHLHAVSVPRLLSEDPPSASQLRSAGGGCGLSAGVSLSGA